MNLKKNLNFEKLELNRASPQPDRAGIGLDLFSPIGLAKIGLSPIRAECFRAGSGGPNADPWFKPFTRERVLKLILIP